MIYCLWDLWCYTCHLHKRQSQNALCRAISPLCDWFCTLVTRLLISALCTSHAALSLASVCCSCQRRCASSRSSALNSSSSERRACITRRLSPAYIQKTKTYSYLDFWYADLRYWYLYELIFDWRGNSTCFWYWILSGESESGPGSVMSLPVPWVNTRSSLSISLSPCSIITICSGMFSNLSYWRYRNK